MIEAESIKLPDEGPMFGKGGMQISSIVILIMGWIAGFGVIGDNPRLGAAILVASAIPAAIVGLQVYRLFRRIGRAQLLVNDERVPLGWSGTFTYVRPLRGATLRQIEARLQCEEHVETGSGRSHREWREVVVDEPLAPQPAPMLEELRVTIPVRIPAAGPPSFESTGNHIVWWVRLRLVMDGCPNTRSSFRIDVAPAVVSK